MRLIDADALTVELEKEYEVSTVPLDDEDIGFMSGIATAIDRIAGTPTSDPTVIAPIQLDAEKVAEIVLERIGTGKHGRWMPLYDNVWKCSECGWVHDIVTYGRHYCPNCGARMDGGADAVKPCSDCQEWDCYGCKYKQTERSE